MHIADRTKPLRDRLQKESQWIWRPPQEKAFQDIKSSLRKAPVLALYDPNRETKISAVASSFGLGGVLLQKQDDESWRPVLFISRALTPVECRYAHIEKEALALTWACEQCTDYIVSKSIIAETDHKPLVRLLTKRTQNDVPPQIQRLRMRLMRFHFKEVIHVRGKEMYVADAISRIQITSSECESTRKDQEIYLDGVLHPLPVSDIKLLQIKEAQDEEPLSKKIKDYCLEGWPDKFHLNDALKPYWSDRGELSLVQGVLLKSSFENCHSIIPEVRNPRQATRRTSRDNQMQRTS